jgi:flagellar assembly protein FliH
MKSYKTIQLAHTVREIRLASVVTPLDPEQRRLHGEKDAYARGLLDGEKALGQQLMQQRSELLELHRGVVESLGAVLPRLARESERALIELAIEAAQKVVAGLPIEPAMVEAVLREALGQIEDNAEITVQLHPEDLALLRKHDSPILEGVPGSGPLQFTHSSEVTRGGCILHTRFGMLDARRETKIEQLRQMLPS